MAKQVNPNIGMINCSACQSLAPVRKNRAGKLYFDCPECGRITPNLPAGQERILDKATIWGENGTPPAHAPKWITGNMRWRDSLIEAAREKQRAQAAAPVITGGTGNLPPPPPQKQPQGQPQGERVAAPVEQAGGFDFLEQMGI